MNKSILSFGIKSLVVTFILGIAERYILLTWYADKYFTGFWGVILVVAIVTFGFHALLISSANGRAATFINKFVAFTGMRLLLYLMIILAYIFLFNYQIVTFLFTFLVGYFIFTAFEISTILHFLQKKASKDDAKKQESSYF